MYVVRFLNEKRQVVSKEFSSAYQCRMFVNKARRSKRISLISYPHID